MEINTKNGLEESTPDKHVLIIEIIVAFMHTTYFNHSRTIHFAHSFQRFSEQTNIISLDRISLLFSAWETGVLCVEGTAFSVLYKINFRARRALGLRLAGLREFTTIPQTRHYSDMLKTSNKFLCLYRLLTYLLHGAESFLRS